MLEYMPQNPIVVSKYTWVDTFRTAIISPSAEVRCVLQQIKALGIVA